MKNKHAIPIDIEELDELLNLNKDEVIWQQTVNYKNALINLLIQSVILGVPLYYLFDTFNILFTLFFIIPYVVSVYLSTTMKYSILPNRILFEWGIFGLKKVAIPFDDITAINLVGYKNRDDSTIHFGTNEKYNIRKLNFNEAESRVHITFENVKDGQKVYDLLMLLWSREKKKVKKPIPVKSRHYGK